MHPVEPFTDSLWICTQCGDTFNRIPRCSDCTWDPAIQNHVCNVEEALIEGECDPDPILKQEEMQ